MIELLAFGIGALVGFAIAAICSASKDSDDDVFSCAGCKYLHADINGAPCIWCKREMPDLWKGKDEKNGSTV